MHAELIESSVVEKTIKHASEKKECWSISDGHYHGWSCDDEFYKRNEKEIKKFTKQYGFLLVNAHKNGAPIKIKGSKKYYTPILWKKR